MDNKIEHRKLQFIGGSSFMVSLPKDWIKGNSLSQGDTVLLVREPDGSLRIIPEHFDRKEKDEEIAVIRELPLLDEEFLRRYIYALYILGLDEIRIAGDQIDPKVVSAVSEIVRDLVGMEVISVSPNEVVVRCLAVEGLEIEDVLRRLSQLVVSMYTGLKSLFNNGDREIVESIMRFEKDADRLYLLAVRQENKVLKRVSGTFNWDELRLILGHRLVAKYLEEIGDDISAVAHYATHIMGDKLDNQVVDGLLKIMDSLFESFDMATRSFFEEDLLLAERAIQEFVRVRESIVEFIRETIAEIEHKSDHFLFLRLILENLHDISKNGKAIGEIAFNRSTRVMLKKQEYQKS